MATTQPIVDVAELGGKTKDQLLDVAESVGLGESSGLTNLRREDLLSRILQTASSHQALTASGILEIMDEGYGFLRQVAYSHTTGDVYISQSQIRRFGLKTGDKVTGQVRPPKEGERYFGLVRVEKVNGFDPEQTPSRSRPQFEYLTPIFPDQQIILETDSSNLSTRMVDMFVPIGLGQRGLVVSPPKAGKTMILQSIANAITANHPESYLMVLLIDERPEEVTDMQRSVKGEVISSTFDEPASRHVAVAEMVIEKAKRLTEHKKDVIILLDSITRLGRAYNAVVPSSGKVLTGGVDANALQRPKRFFGAARNIEQGGSLTIIATALIDTGSRMDDVVYEEFKGTGNMEVHLDRKMAERRTFPALDIYKSGTRREELVMSEEMLKQVWLLRRMLSMANSTSDGNSHEVIENLFSRLYKSKDNEEFLTNLGRELVK